MFRTKDSAFNHNHVKLSDWKFKYTNEKKMALITVKPSKATTFEFLYWSQEKWNPEQFMTRNWFELYLKAVLLFKHL